MTGTERLQAAETFIRSGDCACPFARSVSTHPLELSTAPRFDRKKILRPMRAFSPTQGLSPAHVLLAVSSEEPGEHRQTKEWAVEAFLVLNLVAAIVSYPDHDVAILEQAVYGKTRDVLLDRTSPRRPHIVLGRMPLITVCMSPVYPPKHPRYSPCTMLVSTWHMDISLAQTPQVTAAMRARCEAEHGRQYDADELMLDLPEFANLARRG